jgi:hypothetical protein
VSKRSLLAASAAIVAVAAAGGAIAATKLTSPKEDNQAIINDAAGQLGIDPSKLSAALRKALENRIDKAVADGRLTKAQGDELKARIESDEVPLFAGPGPRFGPHGFGRGFAHAGPFHENLDVAATYLGMTEAQLRKALRGGKSLATVAKDKGKTVDGLIDALTAAAEKKWDEAAAAGRLGNHATAADKQEFLAGVRERLTDLVNGRFPAPPDWHAFRGGPPPFFHPHR